MVTFDTKEQIAYETLVLATGGTPRSLPVEGKDLGNVFVLRRVEDAAKIDAGQFISRMLHPFMRSSMKRTTMLIS